MDSPNLRWWNRESLLVVFKPREQAVQAGDLLVGVDGPVVPGATLLNHKVQAPAGAAAGCVSDLVGGASPGQRAVWRQCFPLGMAGVRRLLVEDASLDTCLALLLFACAVQPRDTDPAPLGAARPCFDDAARLEPWLSYVRDWEQGRYVDGDDVLRSPACQMASLAHALLSAGSGADRWPDATSVDHAVRACLGLLDGYLAQRAQPREAAPPSGLPQAHWASAQLEFERQEYLLALKHGVRTQLRLPLAQGGRRVLVDALFVTDLQLTGVLKVLARSDKVHSWTQRGFAVLGIHRPALAGTGNDMTLSVDPHTGLSLEGLWQELERLENERWGGQRPKDQPRRGIRRYTDTLTGEPVAGAPNQPWYDELGRYTLLGAPRALADGTPGSRLGWAADVLPAVWRLYAPFDLEMTQADLTPSGCRHRVVVASWPRGVASAAGRSDALHQWLASLSAPGPRRHPGEFVPRRSLDVVSLAGGDVIVHPQGLTIFDDWTRTTLDTPELRAAAVELARVAQDYDQLLHDPQMQQLFEREQALRRVPRLAGLAQVSALRGDLLDLKDRFTRLQAREAALRHTPGLQELRDAVARAWDTPQSRSAVVETLQRLDEGLAQAYAVRQERRGFIPATVLTIAGLFVVLRDGIEAVGGLFTANSFELALAAMDKSKLDPAVLKTLQASSELSDRLDLITLLAMGAVFVGGAWIAWRVYFGSGGARGPGRSGTPQP